MSGTKKARVGVESVETAVNNGKVLSKDDKHALDVGKG
jgi:hypothetical protein